MLEVLVLNGPNLNLLGQREQSHYGSLTLAGLEDKLKAHGSTLGLSVTCYQSNIEGELVNTIQQCGHKGIQGIVINPGAYGHTSIAIRDSLLAVGLPFIEVHISNIFARETFRHHTYLSDIADGIIVGLGIYGYELALHALHRKLTL